MAFYNFFLFPNVEVGRMRASGREECRLLEQHENKLDGLKPLILSFEQSFVITAHTQKDLNQLGGISSYRIQKMSPVYKLQYAFLVEIC